VSVLAGFPLKAAGALSVLADDGREYRAGPWAHRGGYAAQATSRRLSLIAPA